MMELEQELLRKSLSDPDLIKLIETTEGFKDYKNVESSVEAREAGNVLYAQKNHNHEIMESNLNLYSMSICYAPPASEEMALGYANRSALLFHLKRYRDSTADIHRALSITNSPSLKVKLLCRKVDCLITLGSPEDSAVFKKAVEYFDNIDDKDGTKQKLHDLLTRTKNGLDAKQLIAKSNTSGSVPQNKQEEINNFNSISVAHSKKYGRYIIATRHIQPGEIVYVEEPHVVCAGSEKLYINCSHCLAIAWNGIPCKHCNWSIFCSSKCRKEAWNKYHFIECYVITHMIKLNRNFSQNFQMSLRAVIMGLRENGGIAKLKIKVESMAASEANHLQHILSDKKCESNWFCSLLDLSSTIKDKHFEINILNTAIALSYAAKYTVLFGKNFLDCETCQSLADNEKVLFTGSLLLKFVQICNNYAYSLPTSIKPCKHENVTLRCLKKYCKDKVSYLAPISSLINNSCVPNVRRCFTQDQKIIVYALESIDKNSQIFESYICSFYENPKTIDRRAILSENFKFDCDCAACLRNWPSLISVFQSLHEVTSMSPMTDLRANFLETQLEDEYRELMKQAANVDTKCDEKTILELRKAIKRANTLLTQPSKIRCTLLFSLARVFDKMYGKDPKLFSC